MKVLDGTFGTATFQVGANVGESISVNLTTGVRTGQIGQIATATGQVTGNALADGGVTIAVGSAQAVSIWRFGVRCRVRQGCCYQRSQRSGPDGYRRNAVTGAFATTSTGAGETYTLDINGTAIYSAFDLSGGALTGGDVASQINLFSSQTGVSASFDAVGGNITLTTTDGRNIVATETFGGGATGGIDDAVAGGVATTTLGQVTLTATDNITLTGAFADLGLGAVIAKDAQTLDNVSITTVANANDAISRIDSALTTISSLRSEFGAIQNRFESTIVNLQTVSESLTASRGRIQDADFAAETASLTKAQIFSRRA